MYVKNLSIMLVAVQRDSLRKTQVIQREDRQKNRYVKIKLSKNRFFQFAPTMRESTLHPHRRSATLLIDLLFVLAQVLHVNRLHHLLAVGNRGFLERLAAAEFLYNAGTLVFTLELLESLFDVFALFDLYDNHVLCVVI